MITSIIKNNKILKTAGIIVFWIIVWELLTLAVNPRLMIDIPSPCSTFSALIRLVKEKTFWSAVGMSVLRIVSGFVFAVVLGTAGSFLSHKSKLFRALSSPLLFMTRSIPVASFIILVFLWLTKSVIPVFISFLMVLPIVWSNIESGLGSVDVKLKEMAYVMGFSRFRVFREITLPALKPYAFSAMITGLGFAWKSGIAAEVIARSELSIGELMWVSKSSIDYDGVFAVTVVILLLSLVLENILKLLIRGNKHD